jgi:hypothetical protein
MSLLRLLVGLLEALKLWLELRNRAYYATQVEYHRHRMEALEDELESLRNDSDSASALRGDRVRNRLIAEREWFESVSAADAAFKKGPGSADK